jgi:hypothetical protein
MINYNKAVYCLLPILNIHRDELLYDKGLLNVYINCQILDGYKNHLFFVYDKKFYANSFKVFLESNELYEDSLILKDKIVVVIYIPNEFKQDIEYYKQGKYSLFSEKLKSQIHKCHNLTPKKNLFRIIWKKKSLKLELETSLDEIIPDENDLWDIPYDYDLNLYL